MKMRTFLALLGIVATGVALSFACAPNGFAPEQQIASVRILATRADHDTAYAHPGESVTLESLVLDGRTNPSPPMKLYWIPFVCENPTDDLYYACFAGAGEAGAAMSGFVNGEIDAGEDASADDSGAAGVGDAGSSADASADDAGAGTAAPPASPTLTFTVPANAVTAHPVVAGAPAPYGLMIAFNVACAGTLKLTSVNPAAGPQQVPIACVDDAGTALGPDDYVVGFTRVYVFDSVSNKNPEIDGIVVNGVETKTGVAGTAVPNPVDVDVPACTATACASLTLDVDVPESSWELNPNATDANGNPTHESLWVDYFAVGGDLDSEARLLYDATSGLITSKGRIESFALPPGPGVTPIWAVVHDNRDGVTWLQVNLHAK